MAVLGSREILPRTFEHRLGDSPTASRVFAATLDSPTAHGEILAHIGIQLGASHPEHINLICDSISVDETDRQHATVSYTYGIPDPDENPENDPNNPPWLQADSWSFSTSNASVACSSHFLTGANNPNIEAPLTNTAGDAIFGISKAEGELKISITGARLTFNLPQVRKYVNSINDREWAGFPKHTVQCVAVSASPDRLEWNGLVQNYWRIAVELVYRPGTHNIALPNVGWNVIVNNKKERAWVYITENGQRAKVAAPHPVALNADGFFLCGPAQDQAANWDANTNWADDGIQYYR